CAVGRSSVPRAASLGLDVGREVPVGADVLRPPGELGEVADGSADHASVLELDGRLDDARRLAGQDLFPALVVDVDDLSAYGHAVSLVLDERGVRPVDAVQPVLRCRPGL